MLADCFGDDAEDLADGAGDLVGDFDELCAEIDSCGVDADGSVAETDVFGDDIIDRVIAIADCSVDVGVFGDDTGD